MLFFADVSIFARPPFKTASCWEALACNFHHYL